MRTRRGPAPIGALVKITYDTTSPISVGDFLRSTSGRAYRIEEAHRVRGKSRYRMVCLVTDDIPPGAHVHQLVWYSRNPKLGLRRGAAPSQKE